MDNNGKVSFSSCSSSSLSPPTPPATEAAAQAKRKAGGAKGGFWMKRMDLVDEDIDANAEEFIKRFRENLMLQRLQSIENYKQMLARGV